jgi:hypothetical protein
MPAYVFRSILEKAASQNITPQLEQNSINWFRNQAKSVVVNPNTLLASQRTRLTKRPLLGSMYVFRYDPKLKATLPYYDTFPLVIPFDAIRDKGRVITSNPGFMGLNLHYLPYDLRARLLDNLYSFLTNNNMDKDTRFKFSYKLLQRVSQLRFFKPCVKKYLFSHMRSQFFFIESKEWDMAAFLNIARFQGANQKTVWTDSRGMI